LVKGAAGRIRIPLAFAAAAIGVILALLSWRDSRVDAVLRRAGRGDVLRVGTDVCEVLRARQLIAPGTACGYRQTVDVRLIADPP
jgi:hypothetical protein